MAINPQSLQILGMVLDRQQRSQEMSAQRGHETNMANMSIAQRNLENQLNMNFQRQQNTESQINNLENTFISMGIDSSKFGSDSQLGEMFSKIKGSLVNQSESLNELTSAQQEHLESLRSMGSAFTRGATTASKYSARFDENFELDPTSDFGAFNLAVGNEDRMAELFAERGIDLDSDPRDLHAFIQGASSVFADTSSMLERERMKMDAIASRRNANNALLQRENLDLSNFRTRLQLSKEMEFDPTELIKGDLMILADPDADSGTKETLQENINARIEAGSRSFTKQIARMAGVDTEYLDTKELEAINEYGGINEAIESGFLSAEEASNIKYYQDLEEHYRTTSSSHINNILSNSKAFVSSLQKSGVELERALADHGTLENAIKNQAIAPTDLGNILGFVGNPYLNDTIGGGFQTFNEIINTAKAQEEIMQNNNPSAAAQKATDAYNRQIGIDMGDDIRTFISRSVFPEPNNNNNGNNENGINVENPYIAEESGLINSFDRSIDSVPRVSRAAAGPVGGYIGSIATVPYRILSVMAKTPGAIGRFFKESDRAYFKQQAVEQYGETLNSKIRETIESVDGIEDEDGAILHLLGEAYRNNEN